MPTPCRLGSRAGTRKQGLAAPRTDGAIVRAVLLGLAAAYADCFQDLMSRTGRRFERLHIIGGGCQNELLCRMTARACGVPVVAGPVEATALGNLLVQALGLGELSADDLPAVVARSVRCRPIDPAA